MTRPTVDQIAAVLNTHLAIHKETRDKVAAEIAALWAEPQSPASDACPLVSTIHAWRRGQVSSTDVGDAIDARIISLADARIDAKMGAGPTMDEQRWGKACARAADYCHEFGVGHPGLDMFESIDRDARRLREEVSALHARAEAAEQRLKHLRPLVEAAYLVDKHASDLPAREQFGLLRALEKLHRVREAYETSTPTGAARE